MVQLIFLPLSDFSWWKLASHQASVWSKFLIAFYRAGPEARWDGAAVRGRGSKPWSAHGRLGAGHVPHAGRKGGDGPRTVLGAGRVEGLGSTGSDGL